MASEIEDAIERFRWLLVERLEPKSRKGLVKAFALRAGLSRPFVSNFLRGERIPDYEDFGKMLQAAGIQLLELLQPGQAVARTGTITQDGVVHLETESDVARYELVDRADDPDLSAPAGTILVVLAQDAPEVDRWYLMRCTRDGDGTTFLRVVGRKVQMRYDPDVFAIVGYVRWEMRPGT